MILTDTHTHLYYETDEHKRKDLMERSLANKVSRLFLPNVNTESIQLIDQLSTEFPENCFPMLGLHPCEVNADWQRQWDNIKNSLNSRKIYAVGEIGIDLYWEKAYLKQQVEAFEVQISWAKTLNLPIVIHCRDAFNEVYDVLQRLNDERLRGIFHCFTGTAEQAHLVTALGFYLGIGGVVTYKNGGLDKVLPEINPEYIVLETDSPYLSPVPYRGKPNESSYLVHIAQKVADIYQQDISMIADITTQNSKKIFGI